MPRPRTTSDEAILEAAFRVISRLGPAQFTLSDVARESGLAPATLLQRFGSKRGLLLALAKVGADSVDACFMAIRKAHASPFKALVIAATEMTRMVTTPQELANSLAFLQQDISDPEFHRLSLKNSTSIVAGYQALIKDAIKAGELRTCNAQKLARAVAAVSGGSLLAWAIHRQGSAETWVRGDLAMLLEPYRTSRLNSVGRS